MDPIHVYYFVYVVFFFLRETWLKVEDKKIVRNTCLMKNK